MPHGETLSTEATSAVDVGGHRLPILHKGCHLTAVHEAEMLSKVVFAIECPGVHAFLFTLTVIVSFQMIVSWIKLIAMNTSLLSSGTVGDHRSKRSAYPLL